MPQTNEHAMPTAAAGEVTPEPVADPVASTSSEGFENAPVALAVCDAEGRILTINDAWPTATSDDRAALTGQSLCACVADRLRTAVSDLLTAAREAPDRVHTLDDVTLRSADPRHTFLLRVKARQPGADGGAAILTCALLETPPEAAVQDYRDSLDATKSRFLKTASHDLRQPLNALNLFLGVLQAGKSLDHVRTVAGQMQATVDAINETFATMLELAKLDMGTAALTPTRVDLRILAQEALETWEDTATGKGLALRLAGPSVLVETDPAYLARMLRCLLANAVRVTAQGGVLVAIRRRGAAARLDVIDTGPGFAPEERSRMFEPFYRIDPGTQDGADRYGLGLSVVRAVAARLNLGLDSDARLGRGARFSILIPPNPRPPT